MKQPSLHSQLKLAATSSRHVIKARRVIKPRHLIHARNWLFIALSFSSGLSQANCDNTAGRLESSEGKVAVEQDGQWQPLTIGACVPINTRIQVSDGRAVFRLANETLLRTSSSTLLRFSAPQEKNWIRLFDGILHFITRTPHAFDVQTDYVNAGVKGTEFMLAANRAEQFGEIVMLEGEVLASNDQGQQQVRSGEAIIARNGQAPRILTVPALRSAVQWTLYYPPLPSSSAPRFQPALAYLYRNDAAGALTELEKLPASDRDADYFALIAAVNLHRGETNQARTAIDKALTLKPDHAQALALNSISELAVGNQAEAARLLDRTNNSRDASVLIARSYLQQAQFELPAALDSAQQAAAIDASSALIQARIAELSLMTGDTSQARKSARNAIALQPDFARAHAIAGFALIQQLKFDDAESEFKRASELDTTDPLPRLGLGLIQIRHNHVREGREQLAMAVALDPGQSLLRSYLGKAYQEEGRERLASDQYALAKTFDNADPTPWFYSALLAHVQNRPFDALDDLNRSIELNDNRAVYRSRLQLDADEATRTASQAEIYRELGFDTLAQRTAARAVSAAPSEYGGHRQLAEAYADDPQYDAARASEVLQAQLLQPLSATPILPLLGETNLLAIEGAGPSALGFREYNAMFVREKPWLSVSGLGGSNHTGAGEITLSGIYDRFSYALSQYHYETQGHRDDSDVRYDITSAYTKFQANEQLSFLLQLTQKEQNNENLDETLLEIQDSPLLNEDKRVNSILLGNSWKPSQDFMVLTALTYSETKFNQTISIPDFDLNFDENSYASNAELQAQWNHTLGNLTTGAGSAEISRHEVTFESTTDPFLAEFLLPPALTKYQDRFNTGYFYWTSAYMSPLTVTIATTYAELDKEIFIKKISGWYPKIGAIYQLNQQVSLRGAYFQTLQRPLSIEQTLEPTQIAGFNQLFDDGDGVESKQYALGLDIDPTEKIRVGGEISTRDSKIPSTDFTGDLVDAEQTQGQVFGSWSIYPWALSLSYNYEKTKYTSPIAFSNTPTPLTTQRTPLQLRWFATDNITLTTTVTLFDQSGEFIDDEIKRNSHFTLLDFSAKFRIIPQRAEVELRCNNIFNKDFKYQNTNLFDASPRLTPYQNERTATLAIKFLL